MHAVAGGTGGPTGGVAAATSSASKHGKQGQQRAATFDVADARDYELKRLGNRRSQQQAAPSKRNGGAGAPILCLRRGQLLSALQRRLHELHAAARQWNCSQEQQSPAPADHHTRDQQQQQQQRERREKTFKV
ncbi:GM18991 [Drosophila sechellia]|uniref:GM18991 n=1 Tax=Drosophila sechellia TaxID=7238 RepID=B4I9B5_DROSE|nr:GM18991 [Drosophila sechellia]